MKLYCLSDHPNAPCLLLKFKGVTILLDCGLDLTSLQHFLPLTLVPSTRLNSLPSWSPTGDISAKLKDEVRSELRECSGRIFVDGTLEVCLPELGIVDLSTVDAILVSNYHCILALPFITEYTGFRGTVYCTEPTKQTGRQLMEEFVEYTERVPKTKTSATWKNTSILKLLPAPLRDTTWVASWRKCYTKHDINACMSKVNVLGFSQKLNLFGSLRVTPHSSGYCLGSCNWVIKSEYEKVCYVSSSSFLTTHSIPIVQEPLKHSDLLLLTGITQTPSHNPDNMLGEFCSNLTVTIKNGGNVLVPCYPSGIIYDLFECLSGYLDSVGLTQVPMFFISPVAESSLAYSQIFSEWLCAQKQAKVFLPEPPFPHAELIKNNRLKHFSSIHGDFSSHFKTPCVVFTGHPSLRLGDAVHFMELWGKFSNNTVIFIEPNFSHLDALAPFQPLAMKACYCPIDTAISFAQATKMIKDLKPLHIALPECYLSPPASQPFRTEHVVEAEVAPTPYKRGSVLHLPIKRRLERIEITPELAGSLAPIEVKPGVFVATVTGTITARDNAFTLQEVPKQAQPSTPSTQPIRKRKREDDAGLAETAQPKQYVYGNLDVEELVQALAKDGITDVKVEDTPSGHIIHLQAEDTIIQLEEGSTHIFCEGNEPLRRKLRDTLIACLPSF